MEFFIYFYIFAFFGYVFGGLRPDVGECGYPTKSYSLNAGDLFVIQSPDFPKSLTSFGSQQNVQCSMTISRTDGTNSGLYFIFTNGYTVGYEFSTPTGNFEVYEKSFDGNEKKSEDSVTYDSNSKIGLYKSETSFTYDYGEGSGGQLWSAFQAFVYAPEVNESSPNCWMKGQTFNLTDNSKTIPLFSQQIFNSYENCSWTVTVPADFNMKLTIPKLFMPLGVIDQMKVIPDGGNAISLIEGISQEFVGSKFVIQFIASENAKEFNPDFIGLFALVTAVAKTIPALTTLPCRAKPNADDGNEIALLLYDPQNGYANSGACTFPITQKPNNAIVFQPEKRFVEYLADRLEIFDNLSGTPNIFGDIKDYDVYVYEGQNDIFMSFTSDKNTNGAGFIVGEIHILCECANETFVAPCHGSTVLPIMESDLENGKKFYTYCQGMSCSYTIEPNPACITNQISFNIKTNLKSTNDVVSLFYDNNEVWNTTDGPFIDETFDSDKTLEISFMSEVVRHEIWNKASNILVTVSTTPVTRTFSTTMEATAASETSATSETAATSETSARSETPATLETSAASETSATSEMPITSETSSERPITAEPSSETPVTAESSSERPVTAETSSETPVTAEPSSETPVTAASETSATSEMPITSETSSERPITAEPSSETPVTAESSSERPVTAETFSETPVTAASETSATSEMPITSETSSEMPITAEPSSETPVTAEPSSERPVTAETSSETPVTAEPSSETPVTAASETSATSEMPITSETSSEMPITAEPSSETPVTAEPSSERPVTAETSSETPVTAEPSSETPVTAASETSATSETAVTSETSATSEMPITSETSSEMPITSSEMPTTFETSSEIPTSLLTSTASKIPTTSEIPSTSTPLPTSPTTPSTATLATTTTRPTTTTSTNITTPTTTTQSTTTPITTTTTTTVIPTTTVLSTTTVPTTTSVSSTFPPPILIQITLVPNSPVASVQTDNVNATTIWTIKTANTSDTLDLFISLDETNSNASKTLQLFTLQDGSDPEIRLSDVKNSTDLREPRLYVSKNNILTITGSKPAPITLFFRLRQTHAANCPNSNNVFQPVPSKAFDFSFAGGANGECFSTIVAYGAEYPHVALQNLSSNSSATVSVVVGIDLNYRYFDFNSQTANFWNSVVLTGSYNSIVVPANVIVTSKYSVTTALVQTVANITTAQGVIYSMNYVIANYSGYNTPNKSAVAVLKGRQSTTVITCKFLKTVTGDVVQLVQGSKTINITTVNQMMSFTDSTDITFYYKNTNVSTRGFLFEFHQDATENSGTLYGISLIILVLNLIISLF